MAKHEPGTTRILYVPANTAWLKWYGASIRHDLREQGFIEGEETEEEREARLAGAPDPHD